MLKSDLNKAVAEKMNENENVTIKVTQKLVNEFVKEFTEVVIQCMLDDDEVLINGLGKFTTKIMPGRSGTISFGEHKGENWTTDDKRVPVFKPSGSLKEALL